MEDLAYKIQMAREMMPAVMVAGAVALSVAFAALLYRARTR